MSHEPMTAGAVQKKSKIYGLSMTAVMAAVTCVLAPMSIPIGPVPISFTNLAIYLSLYLLGWKRGTVSYLVYVLIGMVGVPVFSGFTGGMGRLLGPTGGYIVGFIPMALIAGAVIDRFRNRGIQLAALGLCVFPFIPGDLVKMLIAMALGPMIRSRLEKAGLYRG